MVRSVALAVGEVSLAEDVVAEAFARAWSRWPEVRAHRQPAAWVMRVALNQANDRFRRRRVERRKAQVVARPEVQPDDGYPQFDHRLWEAVRSLPEAERILIALRYVADLSQAEIADLLGVPPGTVASGLNRARRKLATVLEPTCQEDPT
jgi:RNA polymerase sigma-70 factor (ECF subfamily)